MAELRTTVALAYANRGVRSRMERGLVWQLLEADWRSHGQASHILKMDSVIPRNQSSMSGDLLSGPHPPQSGRYALRIVTDMFQVI